MPQSINFKTNDIPYGKGSLHAELLESTFRTRRRADKINEGETCKLRDFSKFLQRHNDYEDEKKHRVMGRVRKTLEELEAYKRLLGHAYKTDNFMTLRWGFKPRQVSTPNSFHRYQVETRIYHCGFTKETLHSEVSHMIEMGKPERRKHDLHQRLLQVARKRSNFVIDRKLTDEAMRRERMVKIMENSTSKVTGVKSSAVKENSSVQGLDSGRPKLKRSKTKDSGTQTGGSEGVSVK